MITTRHWKRKNDYNTTQEGGKLLQHDTGEEERLQHDTGT